jgi:hydrogenase expression/formation protein HypC
MCLAIPGKVVRWVDTDPLLAVAEVEFGGVTRPCHMACVPEARLGDYVVVHAGVAIAILDALEAARALEELASLPDESDWGEGDEREMTP